MAKRSSSDAALDPCGVSSTSAPQSGVGASDHVSTSVGDKISLDEVIAKLKAAGKEDTRGEEILAAAITLRDSSGRDRKVALRKMANAWGVTANENVEGKYKPRPNSALAEDIQASVCKATSEWELRMQPSESFSTGSTALKKAKTAGAAERGAAVARHATGIVRHAGGTVHHLPETPDDVLALSRLGPNMYQGTLRSGTICRAMQSC